MVRMSEGETGTETAGWSGEDDDVSTSSSPSCCSSGIIWVSSSTDLAILSSCFCFLVFISLIVKRCWKEFETTWFRNGNLRKGLSLGLVRSGFTGYAEAETENVAEIESTLVAILVNSAFLFTFQRLLLCFFAPYPNP